MWTPFQYFRGFSGVWPPRRGIAHKRARRGRPAGLCSGDWTVVRATLRGQISDRPDLRPRPGPDQRRGGPRDAPTTSKFATGPPHPCRVVGACLAPRCSNNKQVCSKRRPLRGLARDRSAKREAGENRPCRLHLLQQGGGGDGVGDWAGERRFGPDVNITAVLAVFGIPGVGSPTNGSERPFLLIMLLCEMVKPRHHSAPDFGSEGWQGTGAPIGTKCVWVRSATHRYEVSCIT